ncbi:hypothetical protein GRI89_03260 [Altererythrobacter salegens]|uniref:Uncharacterized protein n=1 Tax=Croceibacterium salegens TaxID=1737568 RepID=A0A6I4SUA8_9SPHN|nr:hypothetical protein [Croceibacterium salegens]MXO58560.1 hypothetical protein [Croceibacterium salegens]
MSASIVVLVFIPLVPLLLGWASAVDPAEFRPHQSDAANILADLSSEMNALAVGMIVSLFLLVREWPGKMPFSVWTALGLGVLAGLTSSYSGLNYRFAMAEQLLNSDLAFEFIGNRLGLQGTALLFCLAVVVYVSVYRILSRNSDTADKVG